MPLLRMPDALVALVAGGVFADIDCTEPIPSHSGGHASCGQRSNCATGQRSVIKDDDGWYGIRGIERMVLDDAACLVRQARVFGGHMLTLMMLCG